MVNVGVDSYTLKMIEQVTGPLRAIEQQMERTALSMDKLGKLAQNIFAGGLILGGIKLIGTALSGLISVMQTGIGVAQRFGSAVLQATTFRTQNITALDTFLGRGAGQGIFNKALSIGGITSADEAEVVKQTRALAAAGFKGMGLSQANAALLDVHAKMGEENRGNLLYYFQKFMGSQKVEADDLRMAALSAGIEHNGLMGEAALQSRIVANMTGKTLSGKAMSDKFAELKKGGKFTGRDVLTALMQGVNERLSGGKGLGTAAQEAGEGTLAGLMSNLEAAPTRFLMQMRLEDMPGIKSVMAFIQKLLVFFDHGTEQGKKLAKVVEQIVNVLFGGLDKITEKDLQRFFEGALKVAEQLKDTISSAWNLVDKMLHGDAGAFAVAFGKGLVEVGKLIGKGIWEGLWAGTGGDDKAKALPAGFVDELVGKVLRANDLAAAWKLAGTQEGGREALVDALTGREGLPDDLREQVATAREKLGMDKGGLSEIVNNINVDEIAPKVGTVIINAPTREAGDLRKQFEGFLKANKNRKGARK